jgi:hypothetical protein
VIWLQIDRPPDAIIGLSGLPQALNASQFAEFAKDAQLQNSVVSQSLFVDMVKGNSEQVFEGIERALRIAPSEPGASLSRN